MASRNSPDAAHARGPAPPDEPMRGRIVWGIALLLLTILVSLGLTGRLPRFSTYPHEVFLLALLAVVRFAFTLMSRRRLFPLVDLPLLGLVFVFTGAESSPLDPALFLIYALIAFYIERVPMRRYGFSYAVSFLAGVVVMYGLVLVHMKREKDEALDEVRQELVQRAESVSAAVEAPIFDANAVGKVFESLRNDVEAWREASQVLRERPYFQEGRADAPAGPAPSPLREGFDRASLALAAREALLGRMAARMREGPDEDEAAAMRADLAAGFDAGAATVREFHSELVDELNGLTSAAGSLGRFEVMQSNVVRTMLLADLLDPMNVILQSQDEVRGMIDAYLDRFEDARVLQRSIPKELNRMLTERFAMAVLVLAAISLFSALRMRFEQEVQRREAARTEYEEREKENWIALTAGLTHSIGNDILAYDVYTEEALEKLAAASADVPPEVPRNLELIRESNKARLAFIKFLDEFARARKAEGEGAEVEVAGLTRIPIEPMLREVRRRLGATEVADLPRDSRDPMVRNQVRKFLDLPLTVEFDGLPEQDRVIRAGKRGIIEFFCYELFKNALRNSSGAHPIRVHVSKGAGRVRFVFVNDLDVREITRPDGPSLYRLPRLNDVPPCEESALRGVVADVLDRCFEPGRGGGTGLGLFLIRYFVREYYRGRIDASIHDWTRRDVAFTLDLPDDLGASKTEAIP